MEKRSLTIKLIAAVGLLVIIMLGVAKHPTHYTIKPAPDNPPIPKCELVAPPADDTLTSNIDRSKLPRKFDTVPGGRNVYRSNQPTIAQLLYILETHNIDRVIRMNGTEGTGVTPNAEQYQVEQLGKEFIYVNAHIGYVQGKGYIGSLDTLQPYLHEGRVLIHCTAGADRTGYQVAKFIQDNLGWDKDSLWRYTIQYNHWEKFIAQGQRGYIKYMEAFYPYDEWLQKYAR